MNAADNDTTDPGVSAPPARFNFAAHLIERNAARGSKAAFVDDHGALSYAALSEQLRRDAADPWSPPPSTWRACASIGAMPLPDCAVSCVLASTGSSTASKAPTKITA